MAIFKSWEFIEDVRDYLYNENENCDRCLFHDCKVTCDPRFKLEFKKWLYEKYSSEAKENDR